MLGVGEQFPSFSLNATVSTDKGRTFKTITDGDFPGKWKVFFFWPKDFTFDQEFKARDAQLLGGSTDSEFVHLAWRQHHPDLKRLPCPMLADIRRDLCGMLGILDPKEGVAQRATFIVDPQGTIRFVSVNDLSVGRNPQEVLRVLDALQTGDLTPCNWHPGQAVLQPSI